MLLDILLSSKPRTGLTTTALDLYFTVSVWLRSDRLMGVKNTHHGHAHTHTLPRVLQLSRHDHGGPQ